MKITYQMILACRTVTMGYLKVLVFVEQSAVVLIQDRSIIYRGTPIYKAQCISRRITKIEGIRRLTEHRLLDELLQRRMEELEETEGEHELDLLERRLFSCAQQAAWGKCSKSWMKGKCC